MTLQEFELFTIVAAVVAMWEQVQSWLSWPVGLLIVHRRTDSFSAGPVLSYLRATARWRPRSGHYSSERPHVKSLGRAFRVWYEDLKEGPQVFWLRRRPVWYEPAELDPPGQPRETVRVRFSFLRGTIDWERLLADVAAWEDARVQELLEITRHRFAVCYHGRMPGGDRPVPQTVPTSISGLGGCLNPGCGLRLLHWHPGDLVDRPPLALDDLSIGPELEAVASRVSQWIDSKEWFEERGIPWRLGIALTGAPGSGKTTFARGLAVEHNMPVHVFDLATLDNYSFRSAWHGMLGDVPCMALLEDIDAVFDGRECVSAAAQGLTFDCLLNCISGVQSADGVVLVITTNRPETLDPALLRRGRLDLHVEVPGLDAAGRRKMIDRILRGLPVDPAMADDPIIAGMTPADLQEHLIQIALTHRLGEAA